MQKYQIIKLHSFWSTKDLMSKTEKLINEKSKDGYTIFNVSFGMNIWMMPASFVTVIKPN